MQKEKIKYAEQNYKPIDKLQSRMLFFIFKVNIRTNRHDGNTDHYYEKTFHYPSSFKGVITKAVINIIIAITTVITTAKMFIVFSDNSSIAPNVVNKYFTRSNMRFATFSFFRKYLSFILKFKHVKNVLSTQRGQHLIMCGFY